MRRVTPAPDVARLAEPSVPHPGGLTLAPFRALRFSVTGDLAPLTSPPYDVIDADEVRRLEASSPHNVVRLILPRDDPGTPGSRYTAAARTLSAWRRDGVLRPDTGPGLYVYEEEADGHVQRGLVGALGLVDPSGGIVLPHEDTMAGPVADRLALTAATAANLEPIFLVYAGGGATSDVVARADTGEPLVATTADDGVRHRVWAVTGAEQLAAVAADLRPRRAVIADGHHRYATYLRHQADRHAAGDGPGPWDRGLAMLVDASTFGPVVHPIHRVVPGLALTTAVDRARSGFTEVRAVPGPIDRALAELARAGRSGTAFLLAGPGEQYLLSGPDHAALDRLLPAGRSAAWRDLDVTVAHALLVGHLWGLRDSEGTVDFAHGVADALAAAAGSGGTALLLNPTPVEDVVAVAAAGERMPRKSTLFTPKPRTGLLLRAFADETA